MGRGGGRIFFEWKFTNEVVLNYVVSPYSIAPVATYSQFIVAAAVVVVVGGHQIFLVFLVKD